MNLWDVIKRPPLAFAPWGKQCGNWTACNVWDLPWGQLWFNLGISLGSHILYYSPSINSIPGNVFFVVAVKVLLLLLLNIFHLFISFLPIPHSPGLSPASLASILETTEWYPDTQAAILSSLALSLTLCPRFTPLPSYPFSSFSLWPIPTPFCHTPTQSLP